MQNRQVNWQIRQTQCRYNTFSAKGSNVSKCQRVLFHKISTALLNVIITTVNLPEKSFCHFLHPYLAVQFFQLFLELTFHKLRNLLT